MKILEIIASIHNWLADKDFIWWPFSFLRPTPQTYMSFKMTLIMTGCFSGLSMGMYIVFTLANNIFEISSCINVGLICLVGFFVWFNVITKPLWNVRAKKLSQKK